MPSTSEILDNALTVSADAFSRADCVEVKRSEKASSSSTPETPKKKKTEKKLKKWTRPSDKPKRPLCAYNLFFANVRQSMMQHEGQSFTNLARTVADQWKLLSEAEKAPYKHQAALNKRQYAEDLAMWKLRKEQERNRELLLEITPEIIEPLPVDSNREQDIIHLGNIFDTHVPIEPNENNTPLPPLVNLNHFPPDAWEPEPIMEPVVCHRYSHQLRQQSQGDHYSSPTSSLSYGHTTYSHAGAPCSPATDRVTMVSGLLMSLRPEEVNLVLASVLQNQQQ